jgi:hypothetical protein
MRFFATRLRARFRPLFVHEHLVNLDPPLVEMVHHTCTDVFGGREKSGVAGLTRSSGAGFAAGFTRSAADEKVHVDTIWLI